MAVDAVQWTVGRLDRFLREHRPGSGPDTGDPSGWKVPVLVSNFGQETVMVEPFS